MSDTSTHHALIEKIAELLQRGIALSEDVMHVIGTTFCTQSATELSEILYDPSNCEADAILELIFYPDLHFQEKIEPVLMAQSFSSNDAEPIARALARKNLRVPVILPINQGMITIDLTEPILRQLVMRLHIDRNIDLRLKNALAHQVAEPAAHCRLRVFLRNCRKPFSDGACDFLREWIEKMYAKSPYFEKAFRFLLDFFDYAAPEKNIYLLLMKEKKALVQHLGRAEKCEAALQSHHVETLMLRGMPLLCVNTGDMLKKILLIDHICLSMFGKTEMIDQPFGVAATVSLSNQD